MGTLGSARRMGMFAGTPGVLEQQRERRPILSDNIPIPVNEITIDSFLSDENGRVCNGVLRLGHSCRTEPLKPRNLTHNTTQSLRDGLP